jgi:hypothetical protein
VSAAAERPPFRLGDEGIAGGVEWRVEAGSKKPGDLILKLRAPRWTAVGMDLSGLLADFHHQVEAHLYPRDEGFKGGGKYFEHLRRAVKHGWVFAAQVLATERYLKTAPAPEPQLFDWEAEGVFSE